MAVKTVPYVHVEVTSVSENSNEAIVTLLKAFNMSGQLIKTNSIEELQPGMYILQGLTQDGRLINQKIIKQTKSYILS